jgi:hypothetical protein
MGGSGGRDLGKHEIDALEQQSKGTLRDGAQPQRRSVFISFATEDLTLVNFLRGQAKNENSNLDFIDRSIREPFNSENVEYIRRGIRERIRLASVTICFVTENTTQSEWVDWEIRESINLGKGVIAMYQGDKPPRNLPSANKEFGIRLVPWNQSELSSAINQAAEERMQ